MLATSIATGEGVQDEAGRRGEKTASPVATRPIAFDQFVGRDRFGDVAARTGPDDTDHVLGRIGDRKRQELDARLLGSDLLDHLCAAATGHMHVEQDDVGHGGEIAATAVATSSPSPTSWTRDPMSLHDAAAEHGVVVHNHDPPRGGV